MEHQRRLLNSTEQIRKWEQEIDNKGHIENEGALISFIKTLADEEWQLKADLLALAAVSRSNTIGNDALVLNWMEKSLELDPGNVKAKHYLTAHKWKGMSDLFDELIFPPLRETDKRERQNNSFSSAVNF
jgi:hypothetical protein